MSALASLDLEPRMLVEGKVPAQRKLSSSFANDMLSGQSMPSKEREATCQTQEV